VSFTGSTLPLQRRKGVRVNPQSHTVIAAVVGSSLASGERRGRGAGRGETCLLWTVSAGERGNAASTATAAATIPSVVLCVADGIVGIAAGIIRAAARLSGGINLLIGVAAGEDKCCDHARDAEPHGRFPTHWVDWQGKSAITRSVAGVAISLNSARLTLIRCAARNGRGYRLIHGEAAGNADHEINVVGGWARIES
jgi:hypothetical protein